MQLAGHNQGGGIAVLAIFIKGIARKNCQRGGAALPNKSRSVMVAPLRTSHIKKWGKVTLIYYQGMLEEIKTV